MKDIRMIGLSSASKPIDSSTKLRKKDGPLLEGMRRYQRFVG